MKIKLFCAGLLTAVMQAPLVSAASVDSWQLAEVASSTGYTVNGNRVSDHQFGMLKHSNICNSDEMYLTWSTNSKNVWDLPGKRLDVTANFDGTYLEMPLEVVAIKPQGQGRSLITLAHVFPNSAVIDMISKADNVKVSMSGSKAKYFDVKEDTFSLNGFTKARAQAQWACNRKSA